MSTEKYDLDLGHGHTLRWTRWAPDRDLNPQFDGIPDVERFGAVINHPRTDGGTCSSGVVFDGEVQRRLNQSGWTVESWEPFTLSPSILCLRCSDHGFIRGGRWVPA